jgi:hypothetical protein
MVEHEYALLNGLSRTHVGRWLGVVAAIVSAAIVYILLSIEVIGSILGYSVKISPSVLSLVGAGSVFSVLYWLFDKWLWRWKLVGQLLKVPDLNGEWDCTGETLQQDGSTKYNWAGNVVIVQSWTKIRVRVRTGQSISNSSSAALIFDEADGYRLFYSYRNEPAIGETELMSHRGFAEITFDKDIREGIGEYFNGYSRFTFGKITLKRASQ